MINCAKNGLKRFHVIYYLDFTMNYFTSFLDVAKFGSVNNSTNIMASTMVSVQPENSDKSQSALELLRPDPPLEQTEAKDDGEDNELEALRMAALASIRPKKSSYKVQAHPVRSNLLSIVPVEEKPKPKLQGFLQFYNLFHFMKWLNLQGWK